MNIWVVIVLILVILRLLYVNIPSTPQEPVEYNNSNHLPPRYMKEYLGKRLVGYRNSSPVENKLLLEHDINKLHLMIKNSELHQIKFNEIIEFYCTLYEIKLDVNSAIRKINNIDEINFHRKNFSNFISDYLNSILKHMKYSCEKYGCSGNMLVETSDKGDVYIKCTSCNKSQYLITRRLRDFLLAAKNCSNKVIDDEIETLSIQKRHESSINMNFLECPLCGRRLMERRGRHGQFYGCSGFPECRFTRNKSK